jgi:hypothetical protein
MPYSGNSWQQLAVGLFEVVERREANVSQIPFFGPQEADGEILSIVYKKRSPVVGGLGSKKNVGMRPPATFRFDVQASTSRIPIRV